MFGSESKLLQRIKKYIESLGLGTDKYVQDIYDSFLNEGSVDDLLTKGSLCYRYTINSVKFENFKNNLNTFHEKK